MLSDRKYLPNFKSVAVIPYLISDFLLQLLKATWIDVVPFFEIVGKMAFIRKPKLVCNLLDGHLLVCNPLFDQFDPKIVDIIPVGNRKAPFKIGTEIRFGNIEMSCDCLNLD